jgi:hypothetical protein
VAVENGFFFEFVVNVSGRELFKAVESVAAIWWLFPNIRAWFLLPLPRK